MRKVLTHSVLAATGIAVVMALALFRTGLLADTITTFPMTVESHALTWQIRLQALNGPEGWLKTRLYGGSLGTNLMDLQGQLVGNPSRGKSLHP
ncbi:MAG: hypothetical protein IIB65_10615 [Proteobacteria bacterium]|nr:hypothetical protein [Pseudomonadota bacterium]